MKYRKNVLFLKIFMISALVVPALSGRLKAAQPGLEKTGNPAREETEEISAVEDLMREHGLLERILLIYDKELNDIAAGKEPACGVLFKAANIVRNFAENYHEKLEEEHVFPRFAKTGQLADLVKVLRQQHQAGRSLTDAILEISRPEEIDKKSRLSQLSKALHSFVAMYRPHKAREDTILFPALHEVLPPKEYEEMGEQFEERERQLFGQDGFAKMVRAVSELEQELNIYNLSEFTAKN